MPIYAYRCSSCGFEKDVLQKLADAPLTLCPQCGQEAFGRTLTAPAFQLKGTGWYVTDFRDNGKQGGGKDGEGKDGGGKADEGRSADTPASTSGGSEAGSSPAPAAAPAPASAPTSAPSASPAPAPAAKGAGGGT